MEDLEQHMHGRFADLAEEMPDIDLLDRVHRTSRKIRRRRRAMVVTAAAAILAAAVTIPAVNRHSDPEPVMSPSVTTPAPTGTPSSSPTARPSSPARVNPPSTRTVKSWTAVYVSYARGYRFVERALDGSVRTLTTIKCTFYSVSPDGRQVAWIGNEGVMVRSFSGGAALTVWKSANADSNILLSSWSADSTHVLINVSTGIGSPRGQIESIAADGSGSEVIGKTEGPLHLAWSADGNTIAGYTGETDGVVVLNRRTGRTHRVPGISMADRVLVNHVESLSADGSKVVVQLIKPTDPGGDPGWPPSFSPTILDTRTGAHVPIGVSGRLLGARYLPDGTLVVRKEGPVHNTIIFIGPNGKVLKTQEEPAELHDEGLATAVTEN